MKRANHYRTALLCCTVLAGVLLLAGCGSDGAGSAAATSPADSTGTTQTDPSYQGDGRLRLLYNGEYGTTLPFCGVTPLPVAEGISSVWLLTDHAADETTHYATRTPQQDATSQYRVYDGTGTLVYYCGEEEPVCLAGDWLLLRAPNDGVDFSYTGASRLVNLKTGESRSLPGGSASIEPLDTGGYAMNGWTEESFPFCLLLDDAMNERSYIDNGQLYRHYQYDSCGWLELSRQLQTEYGYSFLTALYHPVTGAELEGYIDLVGHGIACRKTDRMTYELYDLASGTVLAESGQQYLLYHGGITVTQERDGPTLWDNAGNVYHTADWTIAADGTLVVRSQNYTNTYVYNGEGALLYTVKGVTGDRPEALDGGRFLANVYNWQNPERSCSTLYGPEGVLFQTEKGSYVSQRTDTYLVVTRLSYAGSYRYDLYDYEGNLLVESLAGLPGTLEETLLPARRGYTIGWMDLQGNWLWSRRMFTGINDEKDYSWY